MKTNIRLLVRNAGEVLKITAQLPLQILEAVNMQLSAYIRQCLKPLPNHA